MTDVVPGREYGGRYRVLEQIGRGGTADVYKLYDQKLERHICLKKGRPSAAYTAAQLRAIFANEADILRRCERACVPALYRFSDADLELYLEYVAGQSLDAVLAQSHQSQRPLQALAVVRLLQRLAAVVGQCHAAGVIVADLKPKNVVLTQADVSQSDAVFLLDFGSSRLASAPGGPVHFTAGYAAPEVLDGQAPTVAADVYALGAILFALLAGREPAYGELPRDFGAGVRQIDPRLRELSEELTAEAAGRRPPLTQAAVRLAQLEQWLLHPPQPEDTVECPQCHKRVPRSAFCQHCGHDLRRGVTRNLAVPGETLGDPLELFEQAFQRAAWSDVLYWADHLARGVSRPAQTDAPFLAKSIIALANLTQPSLGVEELRNWLQRASRLQLGQLPDDDCRRFLIAWGQLLARAGWSAAASRAWFAHGTQHWPSEDQLWCHLARASVEEQLEPVLRRGLAQCPDSGALRRDLGDLLLKAGRRPEALELWCDAAVRGERDLRLLARAHQLAEQIQDESRRTLLLSLILNAAPQTAVEALALARFARQQGSTADALRLSDQGLTLDPLHRELRKCKAQLLFDQQKYELLLDHVRELPADSDVLLLRGAAHYELGSYPPAAQDLYEAIRQGADQPAAWGYLVRAYCRLDGVRSAAGHQPPSRARQTLDHALQRFPADPELQSLSVTIV